MAANNSEFNFVFRNAGAKDVNNTFALKLKRRILKLKIFDLIFKNLTFATALLVPGSMALIFVILYFGALPAINQFGWNFVTSSEWNPVKEEFGSLVPIFGTIVTSVLALVIAVPISFGTAIFLTEICPKPLRPALGVGIELLAAIPSIIYGMWGLFVFAPFLSKYIQPLIQKIFGGIPVIGALFEGPPIGIGIFTAGIVLAVMIIPFISSVMRDSFLSVPAMLKESAYALGATKWEVLWKVVLPFSRRGAVSGIMLGLARAMGETMAVTFVIGNAHSLSASLFKPGNTISSTLANEFTEATGDMYTSALVEMGLILFAITLSVLVISKIFLNRQEKAESK
jgi:phosphate transport system permease protein